MRGSAEPTRWWAVRCDICTSEDAAPSLSSDLRFLPWWQLTIRPPGMAIAVSTSCRFLVSVSPRQRPARLVSGLASFSVPLVERLQGCIASYTAKDSNKSCEERHLQALHNTTRVLRIVKLEVEAKTYRVSLSPYLLSATRASSATRRRFNIRRSYRR